MNQPVAKHYSAHIQTRQKQLQAALEAERLDCLLIHSGTPLVAFLDDFEYSFRANPHFLAWAPLEDAPDSVLELRPGEKPKLHFYQPDDYWHKPPADPADWWASEFTLCLHDQPVTPAQLAPAGRVALISESASVRDDWLHNPTRLLNRLHLDRTVKTDYEVDCLLAANQRAWRGHQAAEQAFRNGDSELAIHLAYCNAADTADGELPYGSIVALNRNGATLHYKQKEARAPEQLRSFLIDAGASVHGYAADITRTHAYEGGEFADLIGHFDQVQQSLANAATEGTDYRQLHLQAHREVAECLRQLKILNLSVDAALETGVTSTFYPHGLGHFLGLQVHDVAGLIADVDGTPLPRPEGHPYLRLTRTLEAGNVLTIEPGLYFIDTLLRKLRAGEHAGAVNFERIEALAPWGGIRIEDDVLVTESGVRNLTREASGGA